MPPPLDDPLKKSPTMQAGSVLFALTYEDQATPELAKAETKFDQTSKAFEEAAKSAKKATTTHEGALFDIAKASKEATEGFEEWDAALESIPGIISEVTSGVPAAARALEKLPVPEPTPIKTFPPVLERGRGVEEDLLGTYGIRGLRNIPAKAAVDPKDFEALLQSAQLMASQSVKGFNDDFYGAAGNAIGTQFWGEFWSSRLADPDFIGSLKAATLEDIQGLITGLKTVAGDDVIGREFWTALATHKAGDDVFIKKLATDFFDDEVIAEAFFETLGDPNSRARRAFIQDVGRELAESTVPMWQQPMSDLIETADANMRKLSDDFVKATAGEFKTGVTDTIKGITKVFAFGALLVAAFEPAIEFLQWMVEPLFGPIADAFSDIAYSLYEVMPPFTQIMESLAQSVIPPVMAVLKGLMPVVDLVGAAFSGFVEFMGPVLEGFSNAITWITNNAWAFGTVISVVGITLAPTIAAWTAATVANTAALVANAAVISGAWIAAQWKKVFSIGASVTAWWSGTAAAEANTIATTANTTAQSFSLAPLITKVSALWSSVTAWVATNTAVIANTIALWANNAAVWVSVTASSALAVAQGALATTVGLASGALAVFNAVILANPITWIVVGVAALSYAVYKVIDAFVGWEKVWGGLVKVGTTMVKWVLWPFKFLIGEINAAIDTLASSLESIGDSFSWLGGVGITSGIQLTEAIKPAEVAGQNAISGFAHGIEKATPEVESKTEGALGAVSDRLPHSEPKKGPLVGLRQSGAEILGLMSQGVEDGGAQLQASVESTLGNIEVQPPVGAGPVAIDLEEAVTKPIVGAVESFHSELMFFLEEVSRKTVDLRHDASVFARFQV